MTLHTILQAAIAGSLPPLSEANDYSTMAPYGAYQLKLGDPASAAYGLLLMNALRNVVCYRSLQ